MADLQAITKAVGELDEPKLVELLNEFIASCPGKKDAQEVVAACQQGMALVGDLFESGEYFVGDLIFAGELLTAAIGTIKPVLGNDESVKIGSMVVATVEGDLHDIGKNIFKSMAEATGFEVYDLGIDAPPSAFVEKIKEVKPQIVGMSGVLTLAIDSMKNTIDQIKAAGLRDDVKIIIGGNPVTEGVCNHVGADAFTTNAAEGVKICQGWVKWLTEMHPLSQERNQLFYDVFEGRIPKRVPIAATVPVEFAIQYAGEDLIETQWNAAAKLEEIFDKICQDFLTDTMPVKALRFPSWYQILGAKNWVMSSSGFLQHPEIEGMLIEEYDDFIANPYNCILEKILPRLYANLNTDSTSKALTLAKAFKAFSDEMGHARAVSAKLIEKYGYATVNLSAGFCEAPFDFVADLLRGFKGISTDVRRVPDKVAAASEASLPLMLKAGIPPIPSKHGSTFIPLHMAPYLRTKDFEKLYWPTFKKLVEGLAEAGMPSFLFAEQDWMRYLDYLEELPGNTRIMFEYGDPKLAKEKIGKKHIIMGFYPISLLKTGTKQQCIDKAKELIDILAPGGKYIFSFDKAPVTVDSIDVENHQAVLEYVATNANY